MEAWSGAERGVRRGERGEAGDGMGPSVIRACSGEGGRATPPLKNGNELRAAGYLVAVGSRTARFRSKHKNKVSLVLILLLLLMFCLLILMTALYVRAHRRRMPRVCTSRECLRSAANLATSMDRSADPCHDFYQFVCGNWAQEHPRPDALKSYDWFREKQTRVYAAVRDVLTRNLSDTGNISKPLLQAKDLYTACMDTETLDKLGLKPAISILDSLGLPAYPTFLNVTTEERQDFQLDWLEIVIRAKTQLGMDVLVGFDIFTDPRNSTRYRLVMGSPETTNPFPSMHNDKKRHTGRRKSLRPQHDLVEEILSMQERRTFRAGSSESDREKEEKMARVMKVFYAGLMKLFVLETSDANATALSESELDNNVLEAANEFYTLDCNLYELETNNDTESEEDLYVDIPEYTATALETATGAGAGVWARYLRGVFNATQVTLDLETDTVLVSEPDLKYLQKMLELVSATPPLLVELYLWMKVVEVMAVHTTTEVRLMWSHAQQAARGKAAGGAGEMSRGLLCADAANDMMGLALASAIVDPHFLNVTKPKIERMVFEMKNALSRLVGRARWMDDDTKLATYHKIVRMRSLVGYPEWLLQEGALEEYYRGVQVSPTTHLHNMVNIIQVKIHKALNKFREGNNVTWATDPTEVNAFHTFQENTITVPLVMLQYPFFDLGLDSLNYGSLGTILGHEITHGFDNFGRQFDKSGNLVPWWSNQTVAGFLNATSCFVHQYSQYLVPELGEYVDGKKTLGENIADAGGVREAYAALREHLYRSGPERPLPGFEGLTSEQLFFLSYGNLWCGVWTTEALSAELRDEHAPQRYRAAGALRNVPEFARAWRCPPETPMNPHPEDRCIVF